MSVESLLSCLLGPFGRGLPGFHVLQPVLHRGIRYITGLEESCRGNDLSQKCLKVYSTKHIRSTGSYQFSHLHQGISLFSPNSPALRNVKPGLLADLNQTPAPQPSHHARVISLPLSAFCVYVLGSGLVVSMSAVCTNRWAECLCVRLSIRLALGRGGWFPKLNKMAGTATYIAPAHLRQSMQSDDESGGQLVGFHLQESAVLVTYGTGSCLRVLGWYRYAGRSCSSR